MKRFAVASSIFLTGVVFFGVSTACAEDYGGDGVRAMKKTGGAARK